MTSPLEGRELLILDEAPSTQAAAASALHVSPNVGAVLARHQTSGRGRFNREWFAEPNDSLACTYIFRAQKNHPKPYLLGMALAAAAAGIIHCQLKWPNDLQIDGRKVGGILTEVVKDADGSSVALVGVGINLNQREFPSEIADRAVSLYQAHGWVSDPVSLAHKIDERLQLLPEPSDWSVVQEAWDLFDATAGTMYRPADGRLVEAIGIGSEGQLIGERDGECIAIYAADAILSQG